MRTPATRRRLRTVISAVGAVVVSAALLGVMGFGFGAIPALGPALDPGRGAWTSAADGRPVTSQVLNVPGLTRPVTVSFTKDGLASINAADEHDTFLALGYVHAKYRLAEMDLERRLGEGQLAQLAGPSDVDSDKFELRLGSGAASAARAGMPWRPTPRASTTTSPRSARRGTGPRSSR